MLKKEEKKSAKPQGKILKNETLVKNEEQKNVKTKEVKEFKIRARFLRIAPRKVRLIINLIKGLTLTEAEQQLSFSPKRAAVFLKKILKSIEATAAHNYNLAKEDIYLKNIIVNQGPTLHRYKAAAYGTVHPIRKRSSHLEIVVAKQEDQKEKVNPAKRSVLKRLGLKKDKKENKKNGTKS